MASPTMPVVPGVTHRTVQVGDLEVHVAEAGHGEPLILLHGWPQHWYCWHRVVPLLADRYRLVMPDLRGHGWTSAPTSGYDKEQLASDLLNLMDVLELPHVGLVGHDWGGWTGFLACLRAPERFRAFLALGIVHPFQRPSLSKALQGWRMAYQLPLSTPLLGQALMRAGLAGQVVRTGARAAVPNVATYSQVMREPARARATVALYRTFLLAEGPQVMAGRYVGSRLTVPTRLLNGSSDLISSRAVLDGWQSNADDMTVEVLEGIGHFVPEEAPEVVAERARAMFS